LRAFPIWANNAEKQQQPCTERHLREVSPRAHHGLGRGEATAFLTCPRYCAWNLKFTGLTQNLGQL
jgi:hypothetical protein